MKINRTKAIAVVTTALLIASLFWLMNATRVNGALEAGLNKERLHAEELLSEKLSLEKDIQKMKEQLLSIKEKNAGMDTRLKDVTAKLEKQESDYNRMKKENLSLAQLKKQRLELTGIQNQLQNEIMSLQASRDDLLARNAELHATVASLQERNRVLNDDLARAMFSSLDQSQVVAIKGKSEKLTVKATRAKKLVASFQVPSSLRNLTFRIIDSKGNRLEAKDGTVAHVITPGDNNALASASPGVQSEGMQNVEVTYNPKKKLSTGIYTVEVLNENLYVASLKVKLK